MQNLYLFIHFFTLFFTSIYKTAIIAYKYPGLSFSEVRKKTTVACAIFVVARWPLLVNRTTLLILSYLASTSEFLVSTSFKLKPQPDRRIPKILDYSNCSAPS